MMMMVSYFRKFNYNALLGVCCVTCGCVHGTLVRQTSPVAIYGSYGRGFQETSWCQESLYSITCVWNLEQIQKNVYWFDGLFWKFSYIVALKGSVHKPREQLGSLQNKDFSTYKSYFVKMSKEGDNPKKLSAWFMDAPNVDKHFHIFIYCNWVSFQSSDDIIDKYSHFP